MKSKTITINYKNLRFEHYDGGYEYQVLNFQYPIYKVLNINNEEIEYFSRQEIKSVLMMNGCSKYEINTKLASIDTELDYISNKDYFENTVCLVDESDNFISIKELLNIARLTDYPIEELEKEYSVVVFKEINK